MKTLDTQWFRQHGNLVSYLAALVVFLTFVSREGLSEHWGHVADTIDTATYMYGLRTQLENIEGEVKHLRRHFDEGQSKEMSPDSSWEDVRTAIVANMASDKNQRLDDIRAEMETIRLLTEVLPSSDENNRDLEHVGSELVRLDFEQEDALKAMYQAKDFHNLQTLLQAREKELDALELAADKLSRMALGKAQFLRQTNNRYSRYSWWISVAFLVVGSSLGLLAQHYGLPSPNGSD